MVETCTKIHGFPPPQPCRVCTARTNQGADLIRIFDDPEAMSRGAAELLVSIAKEAVATRGRFSVALSGGGTPRRTYELLATAPLRGQVDWSRAHFSLLGG